MNGHTRNTWSLSFAQKNVHIAQKKVHFNIIEILITNNINRLVFGTPVAFYVEHIYFSFYYSWQPDTAQISIGPESQREIKQIYFFEIIFSLKGFFRGQKESFRTILGPI